MKQQQEIVVVGAGVFGLATAWELAKSGQSVTVLDRAPIGTEASGWALGRLDPLLRGSGSTGETERDLPGEQLTKPEAQQQLALRSYELHRELTAEIEAISSIDVQVDRQPTLQLFYSEQERVFGAENAANWSAMGFKTDLLTADEVRSLDRRYKTTEFGGALVEGPYFIDSLKFTQALAACARSTGVRFETASVSSVDETRSGVTVHTDQGHYEAEKAIIAAGPWSQNFAEQFNIDLHVHPSKGEILRLQPPEDAGFSVHLHGPCSLVNKKDGLAWVAATAAESGFDRTPTDAARATLLKNADQMMEGTSDWPVAQHTVCFRPATPDDLPVVGSLANNVIAASGGGGSGIVHCLNVAREVTTMVASSETEPENDSISLGRFSS